MKRLIDIFQVLVTTAVMLMAVKPAHAKYLYSDEALIDGFNRTVFGSEFSSFLSQSYIRKFTGPVRFYVHSNGDDTAKAHVHAFISSLSSLIDRLSVQLVLREQDANFVVHVVKRKNYANTVRNKIYQGADMQVVGRCMVRSIYSRKGIDRSDAVIVADEGNELLNRCTIEEILQGLGPLNDDPALSNSMFNDSSPFTKLRLFDRYILNMLYDQRIKPGASQAIANRLLPKVLLDARRRLEPDRD